jgi:hypothetical protein
MQAFPELDDRGQQMAIRFENKPTVASPQAKPGRSPSVAAAPAAAAEPPADLLSGHPKPEAKPKSKWKGKGKGKA